MKRSILIESEEDFNKIKGFLRERLWFDFHEAYLTRPTSIVVSDVKGSDYGVGTIGCAVSQKRDGFLIFDINLNEITQTLK